MQSYSFQGKRLKICVKTSYSLECLSKIEVFDIIREGRKCDRNSKDGLLTRCFTLSRKRSPNPKPTLQPQLPLNIKECFDANFC